MVADNKLDEIGYINWKLTTYNVLVVLYFYYFQNIDVNNILGGLCKKGDLNLKTRYSFAALEPEDVKLKNVIHPDKLIDLSRANVTLETEVGHVKTEVEPPSKKETKSKTLSQESLANQVLLDKGITLVPDIGGFMVRGNKDKLNAVTLFPKESCQCPSTTRCYHILAAMRSICISDRDDSNKRTINLSK